LNFFLDNNLPPSWAACLAACSGSQYRNGEVDSVICLRSRFAANTPDVDWIQELAAEKNWTIISGDAFRKGNGAERRVLSQGGLSVFVLQSSWANYQYWTKTAQLLHWWPRIVDQANKVDRIAMEVPWRASGKFKQL
jgi:PIN like domain